jgi:hypothetical protein
MQNLRCIQVKSLVAKIKITENRLGSNDSITLPYDRKIGDVMQQAQEYLESRGINCLGYTELNDTLSIILSDSWLRGNDVKFKSII